MRLTAAALTVGSAVLAVWTYRAEVAEQSGPPGWLLVTALAATVIAFVLAVVIAARRPGAGWGWVLSIAALALGVAAILVSRSREVHLDARGCATAVPVEPWGSFVLAWGALLLAGAGVLFVVGKKNWVAIAFATVTVLIIGYLTVNLHDDALWRLHNDRLGIEKCQE